MKTSMCASLLVIAFGLAGCTTHPLHGQTPACWHASKCRPMVPAQPFGSYEAVFDYIAKCEKLSRDERTLSGLAADSTVERYHFDRTGDLSIVRAEYYGDSQFGIRGAQGQGRYYVFQTHGHRCRLVCILDGNGYRWDNVGDKVRIITWWHISAAESPETVYSWNGQIFE